MTQTPYFPSDTYVSEEATRISALAAQLIEAIDAFDVYLPHTPLWQKSDLHTMMCRVIERANNTCRRIVDPQG